MKQMKRVTIIGGGALGTNAALILHKKGYEVILLEKANDILIGGGAATTNINHSDGFEYHMPEHQTTGQYCIDGSITKALLFPSHTYLTRTCTVEKPIRFFVSKDSENVDGLTGGNFAANAESMREHFRKHFDYLSLVRAGGDTMIENLLGRNPKTFAHPLSPNEYAECNNVVCGYAGSGVGVNMPQYYALLKAALRDTSIDIRFNQNITEIEKQKKGTYQIISNNQTIQTDQIIIACSHHIPGLCKKIKNVDLYMENGVISAEGTYFLNAMTYLKLPATKSKEKISEVSRLNFTLQGEGGCMFACILAPTDREDGYAAVYYPSEKGSQLQKYCYDRDHTASPMAEWDEYIKTGLANDHPHVTATILQAHRYYPFLKDYAEVDKTLCRTVFNAATQDSNGGLERRVRGIIDADIITVDGHVSSFSSPKWTNAELVALIAVDQVIQALGERPLPKDTVHGFGPTNLDVEQITRDIHFHSVKMNIDDAYLFARKNRLPERMVEQFMPEF